MEKQSHHLVGCLKSCTIVNRVLGSGSIPVRVAPPSKVVLMAPEVDPVFANCPSSELFLLQLVDIKFEAVGG